MNISEFNEKFPSIIDYHGVEFYAIHTFKELPSETKEIAAALGKLLKEIKQQIRDAGFIEYHYMPTAHDFLEKEKTIVMTAKRFIQEKPKETIEVE